MKKAFGYVRVSGKGQVSGDGFPRQRAAIKDYAAKNGIKIVQVFEERGVAGTKDLAARPALAALVVALHSDGVKLVLIEAMHRLARDLMIQESIIADFKRNGFEVISVTEPDMCSDDHSRILIRQILGAFAQYEKAAIIAKLRGARQRKKVKGGRVEGAKPYGYYVGEQAILERIQQLRADGLSFDRIASHLNQDGIQPRRGSKWGGWTVNKILSR